MKAVGGGDRRKKKGGELTSGVAMGTAGSRHRSGVQVGPKWGGPCEHVCRRGWHSGGGHRDGRQSTQNKEKKGTQLFTPLQKAQAHCCMCIWCRRRCLLSVCWLNGIVSGTAIGGGAVGGIVMLFLLISVLLKSEGRTGGPSRLRVATQVKSRLLEPQLFPRIGLVSPVAK